MGHINNTKKLRVIFLFQLLFWFLALFAVKAEAVEKSIIDISIFDTVEIDKEKITLGDVAKITGGDATVVEKLKKIIIGRSPLPGGARRIDTNYIVVRLKQNDVDFSRVRFDSPRQIWVKRGFQKVTKENIKNIVKDSLPSILPFEDEQINIKKITVSDEIILPNGDLSYSVKPPKNTDFLGNVPLSVLFYIDGKYQKMVYSTIDIELMTHVVVSTRPLRRNHTITDVDIKTIQRDLADLPSNVIVRKEDVLGRKLIRSVDAGSILRKDLIDVPPMVNRKDIVMMIAECNNFRITAIGESQEDGNEGERVRVVNLDSKKEVYARVLDSNSVKIDF